MILLRPLLQATTLRQFTRYTVTSPFRIHQQATFSITARTMAQEYKLKGLTSLTLKDGDKQEFEVEGIEDGKVLLAKVKGKVHAMSPKCTHYGAPLVKGVLTPEGRITCPWHGACFSVSTGDVEDAPALDPLAKFQVVEKDGAVYITGEESVIKANRRKLNIKCASAKGSDKIVIIGAGSGAVGAIEGLRAGGYTGAMTVISAESNLPYDRTKLSKALMTDGSALAWRTADYYKEASVDFVFGTASAVDFANKSVKTEDGKSYPFTKLILASGGTANMLPMEGLKGDLKNVFLLRTVAHAQDIMKAAGDDGGKKIVVIGSSFIGMEVGNCLAGKKHDVTIIGMEKQPMGRVMGDKVGAIFKGLVEKAGAKFYMESSVEKGVPSKSDPSKIGGVQLKDGTVLDADIVIQGIGIKPATGYLKDSPEIKLLDDGSIRVNESFEVEGLKDVFAIGDIATYPYHGPGGKGKPVRIEHWDVAQNAGRSVAAKINKPSEAPKPFIPVFWSAMGSQLRYCGNTVNGYDDVVVQGETDAQKGPSFVAYYTLGDVVVAVSSMMKDPYMTQAAELMRRDAMPSKSEIEGGKDIMEVGVPSGIKI